MEEQHRSIVLAYTVLEKVIHAHTDHDHLWSCSLTEQPLQPVQPVIVAGSFKENRIDTHTGGSQRLQAIHFDSVQEKRIAHHQHTCELTGSSGPPFHGFVIFPGNPDLGHRL